MNADVHVPNGEPEKRCWFLHPKMGSMRFYLYPVFAMQLLLISFLGSGSRGADVRCKSYRRSEGETKMNRTKSGRSVVSGDLSFQLG